MNFLSSYPFRLFCILLIKALVMTWVILYAGIHLGPDEAQYWTWSQALDWGYYSKPPGIAWQIKLGTLLFGNTEYGVRFFSIVIAFLQSWAIYYLGIYSQLSVRAAFWSAVIIALSPLGLLGSFFAITDGGLLLFWTIACVFIVFGLSKKEEPNPFLIGFCIALGGLFKWNIYFLWIYYLIFKFFYFPQQRNTRILLGIALSLIGFFPSIWWNLSHDGATFKHVLATLSGGSVHKSSGNFFEFLGSQLLLLSPIIFILLVMSLIYLFRQRKEVNSALVFCGMITTSIFCITLVLSVFQKIQGNWIDYAYPTGIIILGWMMIEKNRISLYWIKIGLILSVYFVFIFLSLPSFFTNPFLSRFPLKYKLNPLKHNLGWEILNKGLAETGYDQKQHFLLSDKYQITSLLSFYSKDQKRAYFLNLQGMRKNQFCYWPSLQEEQKGQTGFFVWVENMPHLAREWESKQSFYLNELGHYFDSVEFVGVIPLIYEGPVIAKAAVVFRCVNCKTVGDVITECY